MSSHRLSPRAAAWTAALLALAAGAAPVEVRVTGAGGPLEGVVVFLEPLDARPTRRMAPSPVEIAQIERRFVPDVSVVPVGTAVTFPNRDTVRHHVYSFSPTKRFEIKLYVGTPANPVVFDQPGIAVLGCNIHDAMAAWVVVVDTPWYGRTATDGRLTLQGVPAGRYRLRAWHAAMPAGAMPLEQPVRVDTTPVSETVDLPGVRP